MVHPWEPKGQCPWLEADVWRGWQLRAAMRSPGSCSGLWFMQMWHVPPFPASPEGREAGGDRGGGTPAAAVPFHTHLLIPTVIARSAPGEEPGPARAVAGAGAPSGGRGAMRRL